MGKLFRNMSKVSEGSSNIERYSFYHLEKESKMGKSIRSV